MVRVWAAQAFAFVEYVSHPEGYRPRIHRVVAGITDMEQTEFDLLTEIAKADLEQGLPAKFHVLGAGEGMLRIKNTAPANELPHMYRDYSRPGKGSNHTLFQVIPQHVYELDEAVAMTLLTGHPSKFVITDEPVGPPAEPAPMPPGGDALRVSQVDLLRARNPSETVTVRCLVRCVPDNLGPFTPAFTIGNFHGGERYSMPTKVAVVLLEKYREHFALEDA